MKTIRLIRGPKIQLQGQGNLLKGIDNKTVRRQGFKRLPTLFTYILFSVTHFYKEKTSLKIGRDCEHDFF